LLALRKCYNCSTTVADELVRSFREVTLAHNVVPNRNASSEDHEGTHRTIAKSAMLPDGRGGLQLRGT